MKPQFQTPDTVRQYEALDTMAALFDAGVLASTRTELIGPLTAENLRQAHGKLEWGRVVDKLALADFS